MFEISPKVGLDCFKFVIDKLSTLECLFWGNDEILHRRNVLNSFHKDYRSKFSEIKQSSFLHVELEQLHHRSFCAKQLNHFSHCLSDMLELGCLLPPFQLLGFIWHQMSLELVQSTGWVSLSTTPKGSARSVKQEFLTSMGIMPLRVTVGETQLQDMTVFEIN